jgi:hypothetical protein
MNIDHLCMGCMENKGEAGVCPGCGWKEGTPPESSAQLLARTVLHEHYLLGRALGQGGFGILPIFFYPPRQVIESVGVKFQVSYGLHRKGFLLYVDFPTPFPGHLKVLNRFSWHRLPAIHNLLTGIF